MRFIIDKERIQKGLQAIQSIADRKNTIPILSNVMLQCSGQELNLYATDLEVSTKLFLEVKTEEEGDTTVSARKLFEIVKELPKDDITISSDENHNFQIECKSIMFKLRGMSTDEFPSFPEYEEDAFVEMNSRSLKEMIEKTIFSISLEDIQFNLSGVFAERITNNGRLLRFTATDGHRLSLIDRDLEIPSLTDEGIIIPRKGINEIRRIIQDSTDDVKITLSKNQLIMLYENVILYVRLIDAIFPNYREVIPESSPKKIVLNRSRFLESLRRASIVSVDKFRGIKLDLFDGKLTISSNNPDIGESEETIDIDYQEEKLSIAFNARYFTEVLNALDCEDVVLELDDESTPVMIKDTQDDKFLAVIMPMRI